MSAGSTATMREAGSAVMSVAVSPSSSRPYFGSCGRYFVTVKRRPQDLVPSVGACSVAVRMFSWLLAIAASATLVWFWFFRHSRTWCSQRPTSAVRAPESLLKEVRSQYAALSEVRQLANSIHVAIVRRRWPACSFVFSLSIRMRSLGSRTTAVPQSGASDEVRGASIMVAEYPGLAGPDQLGVPAPGCSRNPSEALPTTPRGTRRARPRARARSQALLHVAERPQALRLRRCQLDSFGGHRRPGRRLVAVDERGQSRRDLGMCRELVVRL